MMTRPQTNRHRRDRKIEFCADTAFEIVVTDDGSRTLRRKTDCVTFHSESGALAESVTVFLTNSGIETLWSPEPVRILETGFGTGLNFWITASAALTQEASLQYCAIEPNPLALSVFDQLRHGELARCQPAYDLFRSELESGLYNGVLRQSVQLMVRDSIGAFSNAGETFDAIFHDPFSPEFAPELWTESYFRDLHQILKPGRRLVTYCVKSSIQKRLSQIGFSVAKTPGPVGGKREVLIATK